MLTRSKAKEIQEWLEYERKCKKLKKDTAEGTDNPQIRKDLVNRRFGNTGYCLRHGYFHCFDCKGFFAPGPDYNPALWSARNHGRGKLTRPDLHQMNNPPTNPIYYYDGLIVSSLNDWNLPKIINLSSVEFKTSK